jgi:uncharacterized RDD family membrane protein YckC/DNA-directed RNA polymerase subunit RPC12/RpoP
MSTLAEQIQHRCTRCYRTLESDAAEAGTEKACEHCGQALLVPTMEDVAAEYAANAPIARARSRSYGADAEVALSSFNFEAGDILAPLWKRFVGCVVDNGLLLLAYVAGVTLLITLAANGFLDQQALKSKELNLQQINARAILYFPVALLLLTQWNFIASRGQSLGKMLLGMKIVDPHGGNPGFVCGVVLRNWLCYLLCLIPFFAFFDWIFIFGDSRRCIHDYLAGTRVVDIYA